jgi:hypothetical protein
MPEVDQELLNDTFREHTRQMGSRAWDLLEYKNMTQAQAVRGNAFATFLSSPLLHLCCWAVASLIKHCRLRTKNINKHVC